MKPTRLPPHWSAIGGLPSAVRSPIPEASTTDLDPPAYTRALTPLPEIERRQTMRQSDREDASNRSFNRQFWFSLASEVGGVPTGMTTTRPAGWIAGILGRQKPGSAATHPEDGHKW